jgi:hypothetical protein
VISLFRFMSFMYTHALWYNEYMSDMLIRSRSSLKLRRRALGIKMRKLYSLWDIKLNFRQFLNYLVNMMSVFGQRNFLMFTTSCLLWICFWYVRHCIPDG